MIIRSNKNIFFYHINQNMNSTNIKLEELEDLLLFSDSSNQSLLNKNEEILLQETHLDKFLSPCSIFASADKNRETTKPKSINSIKESLLLVEQQKQGSNKNDCNKELDKFYQLLINNNTKLTERIQKLQRSKRSQSESIPQRNLIYKFIFQQYSILLEEYRKIMGKLKQQSKQDKQQYKQKFQKALNDLHITKKQNSLLQEENKRLTNLLQQQSKIIQNYHKSLEKHNDYYFPNRKSQCRNNKPRRSLQLSNNSLDHVSSINTRIDIPQKKCKSKIYDLKEQSWIQTGPVSVYSSERDSENVSLRHQGKNQKGKALRLSTMFAINDLQRKKISIADNHN